MRLQPSRLRAQHAQAGSAAIPEPPSRKVFNCIVDDTALIAGTKRNTRDGIRKWVAAGAILLTVPLHSKFALAIQPQSAAH